MLILGVALAAWNWYTVFTSREFDMKAAVIGPFVGVYGVAHAIKARELRILGEPRWSRAAYVIGLVVAAANWYFMCHTICEACGLRDCFEWWR